MLQPHGAVVQGLITTPSTIARFAVGVNGNIKSFNVTIPNANPAGNFVLDVLKNGVSLWAADLTLRPKIIAGDTSGVVAGLTIPTVLGDIIEITAVTIPTGGVGNPTGVVLNIDDGLPTSFVWKGDWLSTTAYVVNDVVSYFDDSAFMATVWICVAGNTNIPPPSDNTKWVKMIGQESPKIEVGTIVTTLYNQALARNPTGPELTAAMTALNTARVNALDFIAAMKTLMSSIFAGAEYIARGRTDAQYVTDLYFSILARGPENITIFNTWVTQVGTDGRTVVLNGFINSAEFYEHRITRGYWYSLKGYDAGSLMGIKMVGALGDGEVWGYDAGSNTLIPTAAGGGGGGSGDATSINMVAVPATAPLTGQAYDQVLVFEAGTNVMKWKLLIAGGSFSFNDYITWDTQFNLGDSSHIGATGPLGYIMTNNGYWWQAYGRTNTNAPAHVSCILSFKAGGAGTAFFLGLTDNAAATGDGSNGGVNLKAAWHLRADGSCRTYYGGVYDSSQGTYDATTIFGIRRNADGTIDFLKNGAVVRSKGADYAAVILRPEFHGGYYDSWDIPQDGGPSSAGNPSYATEVHFQF